MDYPVAVDDLEGVISRSRSEIERSVLTVAPGVI